MINKINNPVEPKTISRSRFGREFKYINFDLDEVIVLGYKSADNPHHSDENNVNSDHAILNGNAI